MTEKSAEEPSWDALEALAIGHGLTEAGENAVRAAFDILHDALGPSWPKRQHATRGWIPSELLMCGWHTAALPLFLAFATRLKEASTEPTFSPVLAGARRGLDVADWRHLLLQLETARGGRTMGMGGTFEPPLRGGTRSADVRLVGTNAELLVETTTLFRSDSDKEWEDYERQLSWSIIEIEHRYGVFAETVMTDHPDDAGINALLVAADDAAQETRRTGLPQLVEVPGVRITVATEHRASSTATFAGAERRGDGWRRLARALRDKARQSAGPTPIWLRVDALDGFFQFTDWHALPWTERVERVANALRTTLAGADHVAGVVLSSGLAVGLGATDAAIEDAGVRLGSDAGLRRLIAPNLIRESVIVALRMDSLPAADQWYDAYDREALWLDEDLCALGLPSVSACVRTV